MTSSDDKNKNNQSSDEIIEEIKTIIHNEIKKIIQNEINDAKQEILDSFSNKMREYFPDVDASVNPYEKLEQWNKDAIERFKNDLRKEIEKEEGGKIQQEKLRKQATKMDKFVNEVIGVIEKIKEDDKKVEGASNPLYEPKIYRWFPMLNKFTKKHERSSRNWLGLLFTGIGLIFLSSGVWNASEELFSIQGSIITGSVILGLMAWLERRKIFSIFGEE